MFRLWIVIALALLISPLSGAPASAQTPDASPASTPVQAVLPGLAAGIVRQYASDEAIQAGDDSEGFSVISVSIFRFDSADNAAKSWQTLRDSGIKQFQPRNGNGDIEINEQDLDDIGDQAYVIWLSADLVQGGTGSYRALYVQDGEFLYLLTGIADQEENTLITDDLARRLVDSEPGTGTESFNADGTSTGDLWDILPSKNDDILQGLAPVEDRQITVP